jgi:hypothetical protein
MVIFLATSRLYVDVRLPQPWSVGPSYPAKYPAKMAGLVGDRESNWDIAQFIAQSLRDSREQRRRDRRNRANFKAILARYIEQSLC